MCKRHQFVSQAISCIRGLQKAVKMFEKDFVNEYCLCFDGLNVYYNGGTQGIQLICCIVRWVQHLL